MNRLTEIPELPPNLRRFDCSDNKLKSLPNLPISLEKLDFQGNLIYDIVNKQMELPEIIQNIKRFNHFRHYFHCQKWKSQFREWLWEKIREKKIKKSASPEEILNMLKEEGYLERDDLEDIDIEYLYEKWMENKQKNKR